MIGDDLRTVAGNIADHSAVLGSRGHVDIVDARARLAHDLEPGQCLEHLSGIVTVRGDGTIGILQVLDERLGGAVILVTERGKLDAGSLDHLLLKCGIPEIEIRYDDLWHDMLPRTAG